MAAVVSSQRSTLNPNAPIFVPEVYRSVEDFSPEWWDLVKTCSSFRDYWLSLHPNGETFQDDDDDDFVDDVALEDDLDYVTSLLYGSDILSHENLLNGVITDVKALLNDVTVLKSRKKPDISPRSTAGISKFQMKPAYCVSPKYTPRRINQPR